MQTLQLVTHYPQHVFRWFFVPNRTALLLVRLWWRFTVSRGWIIDDPLKSTRCYRQVLAVLLHVNAVSSPCWDSFWGRTERSIIRNHSRLVQHTVGDSTAGWKVELTEIQVFEVCVVVGYASYSDCNEISQVQLYLKMLRLKHSAWRLAVWPSKLVVRVLCCNVFST